MGDPADHFWILTPRFCTSLLMYECPDSRLAMYIRKCPALRYCQYLRIRYSGIVLIHRRRGGQLHVLPS